MRFEVLFILFASVVCSNATYYTSVPGRSGLSALNYGLPGLGYTSPYSARAYAPAATAPLTLPGTVAYTIVPAGKSAYTYPQDLEAAYEIVLDSGSAAYSAVDAGLYGTGLNAAALKYGYSPVVTVRGKYGYPLKK